MDPANTSAILTGILYGVSWPSFGGMSCCCPSRSRPSSCWSKDLRVWGWSSRSLPHLTHAHHPVLVPERHAADPCSYSCMKREGQELMHDSSTEARP